MPIDAGTGARTRSCRSSLAPWAVASWFLATGCVVDGQYLIKGRVAGWKDGAQVPLENAKVSIRHREGATSTAADGSFQLSYIFGGMMPFVWSDGHPVVEVRSAGHRTLSRRRDTEAAAQVMRPPAPAAVPMKAAPEGEAALEQVQAEPVGTAAGGADKQSYEGLPARIEIPPGARQSSFSRELLATDAPRPVFAVMVASRMVATASAVALLLFLASALLLRRDLAAGFRALVARGRGGGAAGSEVT